MNRPIINNEIKIIFRLFSLTSSDTVVYFVSSTKIKKVKINSSEIEKYKSIINDFIRLACIIDSNSLRVNTQSHSALRIQDTQKP